ncbi:MAG: aminotransferase class V-fold PLP-dependent enzyme [Nitrososphaeria archaeon]
MMDIDIYKELGVKRIINGCGTYTILGGSRIRSNVIKAMANASKSFVDMIELHKKAGEYIAKVTGAEAAYITTGAAAGMFLSIIACITEGDEEKIRQYPDLTGMKNEVIIQTPHQFCKYYKVFRYAGARPVFVGSNEKVKPEDIENAINKETAAIAYFVFDPQPEVVSLNQVIEIAHKYSIPVIVDAASELPPIENLRKFINIGADLVIFSGGKDIGGPNDTGIICGKKKLIDTCFKLGPYNYEDDIFIGRILKVSKEDVAGLLTALNNYLKSDEQSRIKKWERQADFMIKELNKIQGVEAKKVYPITRHPRPACVPRVQLTLNNKKGMDANKIMYKLASYEPPIRVYTVDNKIYINPQCLTWNEVKIILNALKNILG